GHLKIPVYATSTAKHPVTHVSCQIVDTPGILDRPLEERNEIELRAIAALKTLATGIIFIFDYTQFDALVAQQNLLRQISRTFPEIPLFLICGKADLLNENQKAELKSFWKLNMDQYNLHLISMNNQEEVSNLIIEFFEKNRAKIIELTNKRNVVKEEAG
ncbi:MAG: hypothetical protein ACFFAU_18360, partial [Candidatus Hodarchaeota archaeon]